MKGKGKEMNKRHTNEKVRKSGALITWIVLVALLLSGCGASKPKVYHVGILSGSDTFAQIAVGFKNTMTGLGYVEGQNIVYESPASATDPAQQLSIAQHFVQEKVDLIFAYPTEPAQAAKAATQGTNIPVIFANAGVEGTNLINTVRDPGGNITGVRFPGPEMTVKRFQYLLELAPQTKRIYIPYDPNYPLNPPALAALGPAAANAGVTLVETPVNSVTALQADLKARGASSDIGMDAIMILSELITTSKDGFSAIYQFAGQHNLPVVGSAATTASWGAVFSYSASPLEVGQLAAPLADKVLKGTQAGTIPIVSPNAHLIFNFKQAQALGLTVPDSVLAQAAQIIR